MSYKSELTFSPRSEAHPMNWDDLMSPDQRAVRDLLIRIDDSTQTILSVLEVTTNCFFVYGDRGTGKSTVLLSTIKACNNFNTFFAVRSRCNE